MQPNKQSPLPQGWTQAEFEWLSALGNAALPEARAALLRQHRAWQTPEFIERRYPALNTEAPAVARAWLPVAKGLVALADHLHQPALQGYARLQLAYLLLLQSQYPAALHQIDAAMSFFRRVKERVGQARALHLQANIVDELGDHPRALKLLQQAYALYKGANAERYLASCEYSLAVLYHQMGESERGLLYLQRALRRAQRTNDSYRVAHILLFHGVVYRALERYEDALRAYEQALPRFRAADDTLSLARVQANIGLVYWSMGLLSEARQHYAQAMPLFRDTGAQRDVANCLLNTGILLQEEGDLAQAAQALSEARQLFEQIQDKEGVAFCLLNLASVFNEQRRAEQALATARDAAIQLERLNLHREAAIARINQAMALINLKRFREADALLGQTLQRLERYGDLASRVRCLFLRGECMRELKQLARARAYYDQSLKQLLRLQHLENVPPEERSRYLAQFREIVSAIASFYVVAGDARKAFVVCQQGKGVGLRQALSRPPSKRRPPNRSFAPEQVPLNARTALIEYALHPDGVAMLVLKRAGSTNQLHSFWLRLPQEQLIAAIATLRRAIESGAELSAVQRDARRLYAWLIAPLESHLRGVQRLILCPDGVLHAVPWGVLYEPARGYLTQRFTLTAAPSATIWALGRRESPMREPAFLRPLMVAISRFEGAQTGVGARAALMNLPGAASERKVVQNLLGKSLTLLGEQEANRARVLQALPRATLLHFATHAVANARMPLQSALALRGKGRTEWLAAAEVLRLSLRARLAVLSACSTAEGVLSGDGQIGLAWAFLYAGCPTVLATLWKLPDESTPLWMESFYRAYRAGRSAAEAMQQANARLLQHPRFAHPRYWAAWSLIGSGE